MPDVRQGVFRGARDGVHGGVDSGLLESLAELGEKDREALVLVAWEGLSDVQAAQEMGVSGVAYPPSGTGRPLRLLPDGIATDVRASPSTRP